MLKKLIARSNDAFLDNERASVSFGTVFDKGRYKGLGDIPPSPLKLIKQFRGEHGRTRFDNSVNSLSSASHPSVPKLHEFDRDELLLIRDAVEGIPLSKLRGIISHTQGIESLIQVASVLSHFQYGLDKGMLVHNDLHPGNLIYHEGKVSVVDFDWSYFRNAPPEGYNSLPCTFPYCAPERFNGEDLFWGVEGDIYSLGVLTYFLLSDEAPFDGCFNPVTRDEIKAYKEHYIPLIMKGVPNPLGTKSKLLNASVDACLDPNKHGRPKIDEMLFALVAYNEDTKNYTKRLPKFLILH